MHAHNRLLGQAEILAQYAGPSIHRVFPPALPGHLQHTWDAIGVCPDTASLPAGMPTFVWTHGARSHQRRTDRRVAIGSAWLYLLARADPLHLAVPDPDAPGPSTMEPQDAGNQSGTVWFPQHAVQGAVAARRLIPRIRASEQPVTVALHGPESRVPAVRNTYLAAGLEVALLPGPLRMAGAPGPNLLEALWLLLRRHTVVASNGIHPAHLYGASLGLRSELAGVTPRGVPVPHDEVARGLFEESDRSALTSVARVLLGETHLLSPADVRTLFDWRDHA